jgi:hypothetical protein
MVAALDGSGTPVMPRSLRMTVRALEMFGRLAHPPLGLPWHRHAARLVANRFSVSPPSEVEEGEFLRTLWRESLPPLPIRVQVFCPPDQLPARRRLWRYYARGGVDCQQFFVNHDDFVQPRWAPVMVAALERVMRRFEVPATGPEVLR